jgi:hypothetical protein
MKRKWMKRLGLEFVDEEANGTDSDMIAELALSMAKALSILVCWWLCFTYISRPSRGDCRRPVRAEN